MKVYLQFSTIGEVTELKIKDKLFSKEDFNEYDTNVYIEHDKYKFIICKNEKNNETHQKNITFLPFYEKEIYGDFLLFLIDNEDNIISLPEKKFLKFTNVKLQNSSSLNKIEDYSSDDFNLSD
jgi:hypothetical protein